MINYLFLSGAAAESSVSEDSRIINLSEITKSGEIATLPVCPLLEQVRQGNFLAIAEMFRTQ